MRKLPVRLIAASLMAALSACAPSTERAPRRPDVLLITIDTLRADHVGCYGYVRETTPNIDELAARSIRYANAFSTSSWTLPAHASILTGLYPVEHGVQLPRTALPPSAPTLQELLGAQGYDTFAATSHVYLGDRWGFDRGWRTFDGSLGPDSAHRPVARDVVGRGLRWLERRDESDRPFFIWLHIFDPHWDYSPPPPFDTMYDPDYDGGMTGRYDSLKPFIKALARGPQPELPERDLRHLLALYDGEIRYVDHELGVLLDALRERGLFDSTLIVLASDHGEEFMEHGSLEGHQWTLHDEVVRVPLLIKQPGGRDAGMVVDAPVSIVGVPGAIMDSLGIEHDWRRLDSPALLDLVVRKKPLLGLVQEGFKLLRLPDRGELLFDDRLETNDVAGIHPAEAGEMSRRLDEITAGLVPLPDAGVERLPLDSKEQEQLRSLGYVR
jgi:arylsulfatase A-like enzyme